MDIYRVDDLRIDVGRRIVSRGDSDIPVPKLSFDLLLVLVRSAPNVVSLDEFMERVWPGLVVNPETVSQRVKLLRDAIGDDPRDARYIAGVRGQGYRLIPTVAREEAPRPADSQPPQPAALPPSEPRRRPSTVALLMLAIVAFSAIGVAILVQRPPKHDNVLAEGTRTVAVLPFNNLSATKDNDYIAVGLSEMVLNRLSTVPSLQVVARTSSFALQGMNLDVKEIGRRLHADYLVQGSVQQSGETLRLTAQLTDVHSGKQIKALHLDQSLRELFNIEDEIADSVAASLALRMGDATKFRPEQARNVSLSAYLEYLEGRAALGHFKMADMQAAAAHFRRAIDIDPGFAAAYSSLADAQRWINQNRSEMSLDAHSEIEALVSKAITLDPGLGEAYVMRATLDEDAGRAEADFRKGLELSPSYGLGYTYFAESLFRWNRNEEAQRVFDHAIQIDPLSPRALYMKALVKLEAAGTVAATREAEALLLNVVAIDPDFTNALVRIGEIKGILYGELAAGLSYMERAMRANPGAEWIVEDTMAMYSQLEDVPAMESLATIAGDHSWYARLLLSGYAGDWRKAAQSEFDRPARLEFADNPLLPALAIQVYAHQTHEYDRCIAHLRNRFHLQEGRELEGSRLDAVLALAQILNDKGDVGAGRRLATQVLEMIERMQPAAPAGVFSSNTYRGKAHLLMGDNNAALRDFENAAADDFAGLFMYLWSIQYDNMWNPIRSHPRFQALMSGQRSKIDHQRKLLEEMRRKGEVPSRVP
jgi:TolB-like protein/DNA-binding winged helix-turn-helix (wHTH) protein